MIKTSTLTGAPLDYWTARAEGVPAEQLEIRPVQRSDNFHAIWHPPAPHGPRALPFSREWGMCGPLIEKHGIDLTAGATKGWLALLPVAPHLHVLQGATPQEAICRAVVRAAFGDEVEDVPCQA